ncbi:MAG: SdiA-regulated domain-containing protein [Bacteroidia bacterium]
MNPFWLPFTAILLMALSASCQSNSASSSEETPAVPTSSSLEAQTANPENPFPYAILAPDARFDLPEALTEVSSVSVINETELAMVQDERGRIYVFDQVKKEVTHFCDFRPSGDFEGIAIKGDTAYTLRSDGRIYLIPDFRLENVEEQPLRTFLTEEDDAEGFAYDSETNSLLIACKEPPVLGVKRQKNQRAIYRYDLDLQSLQQTPFLLVDMHQVLKNLQSQAQTQGAKELAAEFDPQKKGSLKPSGIAVHPKDGTIYMIASNGKLLVVVDRKGQVLFTRHLPRDIFSQPEGIDFAPDGTLYISNEGRDGRGSLLRFNPRF